MIQKLNSCHFGVEIAGIAQDCSNSIAKAPELLQSGLIPLKSSQVPV